MNRKRRTKIFIDYARDELIQMAKEIEEKYEVEMIQDPMEGLTMVKVRETAKNTLFYLGEVLVTECKVRINGQLGVGLVQGSQDDLAKALAVADAAYELGLEETKKWTEVFVECEKEGLEMLKKKRSVVARTKVDFSMMDE